MCGTAAAASSRSTVMRTTRSRAGERRDLPTVASMSAVSVLVIDCTTIGRAAADLHIADAYWNRLAPLFGAADWVIEVLLRSAVQCQTGVFSSIYVALWRLRGAGTVNSAGSPAPDRPPPALPPPRRPRKWVPRARNAPKRPRTRGQECERRKTARRIALHHREPDRESDAHHPEGLVGEPAERPGAGMAVMRSPISSMPSASIGIETRELIGEHLLGAAQSAGSSP